MRCLTRIAAYTVFATALARPAVAQTIRAVLFFSPTCPHCHQVMTEDLPVIFQAYGGTPQITFDAQSSDDDRSAYLASNGELEILFVDTSRPSGAALYDAATKRYAIPPFRVGVPRMVIADSVLVGSLEIPTQIHGFINRGRQEGGIDWPDFAGMEQALAFIPHPPAEVATDQPQQTTPTTAATDTVGEPPISEPEQPSRVADSTPAELTPATGTPTLESIAQRRASWSEKFRRDPTGNGVAVLVLAGMVASIIVLVFRPRSRTRIETVGLAIPVIALGGIVVAGYLTYIEASGGTAVCGPVGDCNTVQHSEYAVLFGMIPVGALGLAGYIGIIVAWLNAKYTQGRGADWAQLALLVMAGAGTLFSIYLTVLEPFVIGATCAWCLASSVIMTLLLWLSAGPGTNAWGRL
jgi:uncharacterized membrane protein